MSEPIAVDAGSCS